jgi:hypothetical protein
MKTFLLLVVFALVCAACGGGKGLSDMKILNIDDLHRDYLASKEDARAKYDGKEFVMVAKAGTPLGDYPTKDNDGRLYYGLRASEPFGFNCMVAPEEKAKFDELKPGSVVTVKGVIHFNPGNVEMRPCTREFRDAK